MKKPTYSFYNVDNFSGTSITELAAIFEKYNLHPVPGEFGGGEHVQQIVAWLNIHRSDIAINLLASFVVKILNDLWDWYRRSHFSSQKMVPVVNISINIKNNISVTKQYRIDKEYIEKEINIFDESHK